MATSGTVGIGYSDEFDVILREIDKMKGKLRTFKDSSSDGVLKDGEEDEFHRRQARQRKPYSTYAADTSTSQARHEGDTVARSFHTSFKDRLQNLNTGSNTHFNTEPPASSFLTPFSLSDDAPHFSSPVGSPLHQQSPGKQRRRVSVARLNSKKKIDLSQSQSLGLPTDAVDGDTAQMQPPSSLFQPSSQELVHASSQEFENSSWGLGTQMEVTGLPSSCSSSLMDSPTATNESASLMAVLVALEQKQVLEPYCRSPKKQPKLGSLADEIKYAVFMDIEAKVQSITSLSQPTRANPWQPPLSEPQHIDNPTHARIKSSPTTAAHHYGPAGYHRSHSATTPSAHHWDPTELQQLHRTTSTSAHHAHQTPQHTSRTATATFTHHCEATPHHRSNSTTQSTGLNDTPYHLHHRSTSLSALSPSAMESMLPSSQPHNPPTAHAPTMTAIHGQAQNTTLPAPCNTSTEANAPGPRPGVPPEAHAQHSQGAHHPSASPRPSPLHRILQHSKTSPPPRHMAPGMAKPSVQTNSRRTGEQELGEESPAGPRVMMQAVTSERREERREEEEPTGRRVMMRAVTSLQEREEEEEPTGPRVMTRAVTSLQRTDGKKFHGDRDISILVQAHTLPGGELWEEGMDIDGQEGTRCSSLRAWLTSSSFRAVMESYTAGLSKDEPQETVRRKRDSFKFSLRDVKCPSLRAWLESQSDIAQTLQMWPTLSRATQPGTPRSRLLAAAAAIDSCVGQEESDDDVAMEGSDLTDSPGREERSEGGLPRSDSEGFGPVCSFGSMGGNDVPCVRHIRGAAQNREMEDCADSAAAVSVEFSDVQFPKLEEITLRRSISNPPQILLPVIPERLPQNYIGAEYPPRSSLVNKNNHLLQTKSSSGRHRGSTLVNPADNARGVYVNPSAGSQKKKLNSLRSKRKFAHGDNDQGVDKWPQEYLDYLAMLHEKQPPLTASSRYEDVCKELEMDPRFLAVDLDARYKLFQGCIELLQQIESVQQSCMKSKGGLFSRLKGKK